MCGVAGVLDLDRSASADELQSTVVVMASALRHRGPDAAGSWSDPDAGIALGHRRLSIVDVSSAGAQPMCSSSGRYVLSYNGEIYNAPVLAERLEAVGRRFRGHSDTEVLIEAIDAWGLETALEHANGMFAFALWDRGQRRLHLVRDRLGEKPMYHGWIGSRLVFGSELKALRAHPGFDAEIDRDALTSFLRFNCVPAPASIFRGCHQLPPASILTVDPEARPRDASPAAYWSARSAFERGDTLPARSDDEATDQLEELLRDATKVRMRSDVPLGAFLSGGIDSSTIVALMQDLSSQPVRTFTIGNTVATFDEADRAHAVAQHLRTQHAELRVTPDDALAVVPRLPEIYDEPFADSSQIPTLLVSEMARRDVTVSLSGDGGDETFGGYDRYRWVPRVATELQRVPAGIRRAGSDLVLAIPPRRWDAIARVVPVGLRPRIPATKLAKLAAIVPLGSPDAMYRELTSHWQDPAEIVIGGHEPPGPEHMLESDGDDLAQRMMALDSVTYLPDDILVKLDRASMSVSLETRVPILDHRVVEFAAALPLRDKIRGRQSKWLLRSVLERYVPRRLFERPKAGFGVPIGDWLRGPLRSWAEELLAPERLRREGYVRPEPVHAAWTAHLTGRQDNEYRLWDVLMFEAWLEHLHS
jgi:asparagine synthase (glutamine-hydrolysing)